MSAPSQFRQKYIVRLRRKGTPVKVRQFAPNNFRPVQCQTPSHAFPAVRSDGGARYRKQRKIDKNNSHKETGRLLKILSAEEKE